MNLSLVKENIQVIEEKAENKKFELFRVASNGVSVLSEDLDKYEECLKILETIKRLEDYKNKNRSVIAHYLELEDQLKSLDDSFHSSKGESSFEENVEDVHEDVPEQVDEHAETIVEDKSLEGSSIPVADLKSELNNEFETPIEKNININNNNNLEDIASEPYDYIVESQNEPTSEKVVSLQNDAPQTDIYSATVEEIDDPLQKEVAERMKSFENTTDDNTYKAMTQDQIVASQEKLGLTENPLQKNQNTFGKKVIGRRSYNWKDKVTNKYNILKGIIFVELLGNHTPEYTRYNIAIGNLRAQYRGKTIEESYTTLEELNKQINASSLTMEEKNRLFNKLTALANTIQKKQSR